MSNYINSLNAQYAKRYDPISARGAYTGYNTAKLNYGSSAGAASTTNYVNSSGVSYLSGIQSAAKSMQTALENITVSSTFSKMQAISSDSAYLSINSGKSNPFEGWTESTVSINQLASAQINKSDGARGEDLYTGDLGVQEFEIEVNGQSHKLNVEIEAGDTNKTVLEKMSSAINSSKLTVSASVATASGISTLTVKSKSTGDHVDNHFQIRDLGSGSLVRSTGVDTIQQAAQDAMFMVNGGLLQTSGTNDVYLGDGIYATLKQATDTEPITLTKDQDTAYIKEQVNTIVNSFNSLYKAANDYASTNPKLLGDLINSYNSYYEELNAVGISMDSSGLKVDSDKLDKAIEDGSLEGLMTASGRGGLTTYSFTGSLSAIATGVRFNTGAYTKNTMAAEEVLSSTSTGSSSTSTAWDDSSTVNNSNFNLKVYNNYMALGYFVDLFI